jgi:putative membrane protein
MWNEPYHWLKALHIISLISWMAGMLYLPRLYVYHCGVAAGSEASEMLKVMERKLLRLITWIFGIALAIKLNLFDPHAGNGHWFEAKIGLVLVMQIIHAMLSRYRKAFARDERPKSARYFRILNEVPAVLMIVIVILVVLKPF